MQIQDQTPISEIREGQKESPEQKIKRLESENVQLQGEVSQLKSEKATLEAQVVQVNADLMGFMEYYFENQT
ncbi:hypothetical protein [Brevibacillus reuszeri]|uniref:hypothetical protein n=1 Tax=Brevibacillus reuszeri TaxID=54915 RepID=UPI000CCC3EDD|nr:hypothetical protein [Brevibacillus reuszeri]